MAQIESHTEKTIHRAKNFFIPSAAEIILYMLASVVLLIVLNSGDIISKLSNNYIGSPENLKANFTTLSTGFNNAFSSALGGRLGQIILWSFVGAISYIALWLGRNVLNSFENDFISDRYLHPSSYSRLGYWGSSFSAKIFLAAMVLVSAAYLFVLVTAALPAVAVLAASAAYDFQPATSILYITFAIISTALALYIGTALLRLVSHLWKNL